MQLLNNAVLYTAISFRSCILYSTFQEIELIVERTFACFDFVDVAIARKR